MKQLAYLGILIIMASCGSAKEFTDADNRAYDNLKAMVSDRQFEIISTTARPMATAAFSQLANSGILQPGSTISNIDITTNANSLKVENDSISGYFPYFGEQRFGGGYPGNTHQGIEFSDVPKNYEVTTDDSKHIVNITFKIDDDYRNNENYNVYITLYPNNRSTISINSTNRTVIEYSGSVKPISKEEK